MLQTLAGPVPVPDALVIALQSLRLGLQAEEVALLADRSWRGYAGPRGTDPSAATPSLQALAEQAMARSIPDGVATDLGRSRRRRARAVTFSTGTFDTDTGSDTDTYAEGADTGKMVLLATWRRIPAAVEETALLEDAANSLRLALEREQTAIVHEEAVALRRSRELQRGFLSRLSHELRTPLTAIRGYASSLMLKDVTWDGDSQQRFLDRIAAESARLGRLVDDLLDFSAIESGILRLQRDWCDIGLVLDAAVACLPPAGAAMIEVVCDPSLPVVWADHDRLEQVFVNLLDNAIGHNPPGTQVRVTAEPV